MRITSVRGLAAGAGVAAVLVAGATAAAASSSRDSHEPQPGTWESRYEQQGNYTDVRCIVAGVPAGQDSVYFDESGWGRLLDEANQWFSVVLSGSHGDVESPFTGYGSGHTYTTPSAGTIDYAVLCQGAPVWQAPNAGVDADGDTGGDQEAGDDEDEAPSGADQTAEDAADDPAGDDPDDPSATASEGQAGADEADPADEAEQSPAGPAVETDGPADSGINIGLIGGIALALVGAGSVAVATRHRSES